MRERAGLPIAAYLGMLMALALAMAFVATLAIIIFLPPRPPDVLRADKVSEHFQEGYDHMTALGRTMNERGVVWEIRQEPPDKSDSPYMRMTQHQLASSLELNQNQVRVFADHIATDADMFVFRVGDLEGLTEDVISSIDAEGIAEEVERAHHAAEERLEAARHAAQARREAQIDADQERNHAELDRMAASTEARAEAAQARAEAAAER
ncbi:MAG: hypothetical protein H7124_13765, partial [Phycisphaerales bacterium]|nr:hypothetical protein [Hyphomonadaceae bacterium]